MLPSPAACLGPGEGSTWSLLGQLPAAPDSDSFHLGEVPVTVCSLLSLGDRIVDFSAIDALRLAYVHLLAPAAIVSGDATATTLPADAQELAERWMADSLREVYEDKVADTLSRLQPDATTAVISRQNSTESNISYSDRPSPSGAIRKPPMAVDAQACGQLFERYLSTLQGLPAWTGSGGPGAVRSSAIRIGKDTLLKLHWQRSVDRRAADFEVTLGNPQLVDGTLSFTFDSIVTTSRMAKHHAPDVTKRLTDHGVIAAMRYAFDELTRDVAADAVVPDAMACADHLERSLSSFLTFVSGGVHDNALIRAHSGSALAMSQGSSGAPQIMIASEMDDEPRSEQVASRLLTRETGRAGLCRLQCEFVPQNVAAAETKI